MQTAIGRICAAVVSILLPLSISGAGAGAAAGLDPAALVPASAVMYAATSQLERALPEAAYVINEVLPDSNSKNVLEWRTRFKERTGIDVFSPESLSRADVDIKRPAAVAYLKAAKDDERIIILIPVKNPGRFPLRFVDIMKRFNRDKPAMDLNPVVTRYKNHAVYQMQKDIFFASIGDYFMLAPSGPVVTAVIDIASGGGPAPLADDPLFRDYRAKMGGDSDLGVYMKKEFFDEIDSYNRARRNRLREGESLKNGEPGRGAEKSDEAEGSAPPARAVSQDLAFLDYVCLSIKSSGKGVSVQIGASLKKDDQIAGVFSRVFKTGLPESLLFPDDPLSYYYLALDLAVFEEVCGGGGGRLSKMCETYARLKDSLRQESGIDLARDFLPYYGGYINAAIRKTRIAGKLDNYVVYIPMRGREQSAAFYKKLKAGMRQKHGGEGRFGEERIDALPAFWYTDDKGNRISVVAHDTGLYAGNNTEFLREGMARKGNPLELKTVGDVKRVDRDSFMFFYFRLDSESYVKAIMMLLVQASNPKLAGIIQRIDHFTIIGKRIDTYFSVDFSLSVSSEKQKSR